MKKEFADILRKMADDIEQDKLVAGVIIFNKVLSTDDMESIIATRPDHFSTVELFENFGEKGLIKNMPYGENAELLLHLLPKI